MGKLFGFDSEANVTLNIILHAGTLLAIIIFYFKELINILKNSDFALIGKLITATIPVGILGLILKAFNLDEAMFGSLFVPAIGFLITATFLLASQKNTARTPLDKLTYKQSFLIGVVQSIAVTPGISRSGSTISAGLKAGLEKADAARFSFLMAIPAIAGVTAVELFLLLKKGELTLHSLNIYHLAIGFAVSVIVGYFSLRLLLNLLKRGDFKCFSWYLYVLGLATLIWAIVNICA